MRGRVAPFRSPRLVGFATNTDGRFTSPSPRRKNAGGGVMQAALEAAGLTRHDIDFHQPAMGPQRKRETSREAPGQCGSVRPMPFRSTL